MMNHGSAIYWADQLILAIESARKEEAANAALHFAAALKDQSWPVPTLLQVFSPESFCAGAYMVALLYRAMADSQ